MKRSKRYDEAIKTVEHLKEYSPEEVHFFMKFMVRNSKPETISLEGSSTTIIEVLNQDALRNATVNAYFYDSVGKITLLKLFGDIGTTIRGVSITYL